ncbi:Transposase family tnp2 [Ceratobasidium sp. AG-Ba]|nr:Transposase family tnp2 [Ceratobasidium sp. AG-Ba]
MVKVDQSRCVFCDGFFSRKTVRRHAGGGCSALEREAMRKGSAVQRVKNPDLTLEAEQPRRPHHYHRRIPPPPPLPAAPSNLSIAAQWPSPPITNNQTTDRTIYERIDGPRTGDPAYAPSINGWDSSSRLPPNPAQEEFDALARELPEHPYFQVDPSGERPSHLVNPLDRLLHLPPPPGSTNALPDPGVTLGEAQPWLRGLTAWQIVQNELIAEVARGGGPKLSDSDMLLVRGFNYKIDTGITARAYSKLPRAFPNLDGLPTESVMKRRAAVLAGVSGVRIHCCVDSCVAFTGKYELHDECPYCGKPRYEDDPEKPGCQRPVRTFLYIPLIPRLTNMYRSKDMASKLGYRGRYGTRPGIIRDIFDGHLYQRLRGRRVRTYKRNFDHCYFSMPTDIALGLSADGFGPFKSSRQSCWPLVLFNYNLPPSIRFQLEHILCLGVIPGPKEPKEIGTFLQPLIDELEDLASGVAAWDAENDRTFCLHAYLIVCFGDLQAMAKLMRMRGPGAKRPCRACNILGIKHPDSTRYYACLSRPFAEDPTPYDPLNLPHRTHAEYVRQAVHVETSATATRHEERAKQFGINGLSALADIPSLEFPGSFPHDFMHAMFENVLVTLVNLWTGKGAYSGFGSGNEEYRLSPKVWDAIGAACATSGDTIPSAFGCRVPNLADNKRRVTAEARLLFATLIGPALLHRQFKRRCYYDHFVKLVRLIQECLQLEITEDKLEEIRVGYADWVEEYERLYYRYRADRLQACTLPIHSLLHIANDIRTMGPVWCYWAFPMERFIGALAHANKNFRFVWASLDNHVLGVAQLTQIKLIYDLADALSLEDEHYNMATGTRYDTYPEHTFVRPMRTSVLHRSIRHKVAKFVASKLGIESRFVIGAIQNRLFVLWGRAQLIKGDRGGDLIRGHALSPSNERVSRNASYVKYFTRFSRWNRTSPRELAEDTFGYGRVEQFIVIDTVFLQDVVTRAGYLNPPLEPLVLAAISPIPSFKRDADSGMVRFDMPNKQHAPPEIVDVSAIECLVGRARASSPNRTWYIVERSTIVGNINMLDTMADPN